MNSKQVLLLICLPLIAVIRLAADPLADALDLPSLSLTCIPSAWTSQSVVTHDGVDAVQTAAIGGDTSTSMETTVVGPCTVSFWWKISASSSCSLRLFIDDYLALTGISGEVNWIQRSIILTTPGNHTLKWVYTKNGTSVSGSDCGWIDEVYILEPVNGIYYTDKGPGVTLTRVENSSGAVTFPSTINGKPVTAIGNYAFSSCTEMTSVTIPNTVTSIGNNAFEYCNNLTSLTIPNSVKSIGFFAFSYCSALTSVSLPDTLSVIDLFTFVSCSALTSVSFPEGITSIGSNAFANCSALTTLHIPAKVTNIGSDAFSGCTGLSQIDVDPSNSAYASVNGVFFNKSKTQLILYPAASTDTSYTIPNGVTSVINYAFTLCNNLTSVTIPGSVTSIGLSPFYDCNNLTEIVVDPSNGTYASVDGILFNQSRTELIYYPGSKSNSTYNVPTGVTSITGYFDSCKYLISVGIPDSVTTIAYSPFNRCMKLEEISVSSDNPNYTSADGILFDKLQTQLIKYPTAKPGLAYTIADGVKTIAGSAFANCGELERVSIPDSVHSIEWHAFFDCEKLTAIEVGSGNYAYTSAGGVLFDKSMNKLIQYPPSKPGTNYTIPSGVIIIDAVSFYPCETLTSVIIPNSVQTIYNNAFYSCSNLSTVCFEGDAPVFGTLVFANLPPNFTILYRHKSTGFTTPTWNGYPASPELVSFEDWQESTFTPEELLDPAISGPEADPMASGISNLTRYAFGMQLNDITSPWMPICQSIAGVQGNTNWYGNLTFTLRQNSAYTYQIEGSDNLATWYSNVDELDSTYLSIHTSNNLNGTTTVTAQDKLPLSNSRSFFARVVLKMQ